MSARRAIWEVARRELVVRSRSRAWRISLALVLVLAVGGAIAAARLSGGTPTDRVGLVGARSLALRPVIERQARGSDRRLRIHVLADARAAESALRAKDLDVALIDGRRLVVRRSRTASAVGLVQRALAATTVLSRLRAAGLSQAEAVSALTPRTLPVAVLEPQSKETDRNRGLLFVATFALYMAVLVFGQFVAVGVTEEKSSRVVELLLTTLSPRRLLAGKILGIGVLGLGQLLLTGAAALVAGSLAGGTGLPSAAPTTIALVVLWFILGYAFYSVAYGAIGALVSRQEDLQATQAPVTALVVAAWVVVTMALGEPNGTLAKVSAFLPPFAPLVVPGRVVLGDMGALGLVAAVAVQLLATAGLILVAARVYERAILQIGAPVRLRGVLRGSAAAGRPLLDAVPEPLLRVVAVLLLVGGALLGLRHPAGIALLVCGLVLVALAQQRRGRRSSGPMPR